MAKIKSRVSADTSKPPKMVKAPYIGSYLEGQDTMGKVFNPSLRKFYGWDNIKPKWTSKV
jgi:hypothetical protein